MRSATLLSFLLLILDTLIQHTEGGSSETRFQRLDSESANAGNSVWAKITRLITMLCEMGLLVISLGRQITDVNGKQMKFLVPHKLAKNQQTDC
uniref:Uncharacterized protein n=1 Tax=Trichobilharzia regenti TaxID=157069 RepID=A0AA85IVP7_TRIRE|nr:unnamed protein product [Trichobilharzia regenti]